jgi:SAM-dependent MidA family methyltransferase
VSLKARLQAEIAASGPISVAEYMARCLHDPEYGYYATRPAIGAGGDFLTAPMVSQMFGELVGLWAAQVWINMGSPPSFRFAEAGPGDGTLMADMLRAARLAPGFVEAADIVLVETSAPLRRKQAERLADHQVRWADGLSALTPDRPTIFVANELLDCLPALQFVRTLQGWAERRVGLSADGELVFGLTPTDLPENAPHDLEPGLVWEVSPAQAMFAAELAARICASGGAALLIDYGRAAPEAGDTLQALLGHEKVDPLATPGEADLTVWADFPTVLTAARAAGAQTFGPVPQSTFLQRLGLDQRAEALKRSRPDHADVIERQRLRLAAPEEMGQLFKVAAITPPGVPPPPGLERS